MRASLRKWNGARESHPQHQDSPGRRREIQRHLSWTNGVLRRNDGELILTREMVPCRFAACTTRNIPLSGRPWFGKTVLLPCGEFFNPLQFFLCHHPVYVQFYSRLPLPPVPFCSAAAGSSRLTVHQANPRFSSSAIRRPGTRQWPERPAHRRLGHSAGRLF